MLRKTSYLTLALFALAVTITGCDADQEQNRSVVSVTSLNNNEPVFSDVVTAGTIVEDAIPVVFSNRPYNDIIVTGEGLPYYEFVIEGYTVVYTRTDGGEVPPPFADVMHVTVESGKSVVGAVVVVPASYKAMPPLDALAGGGQIRMMANFTFTGREVGTDRQQEFSAAVQVSAADWADV